MKTIQYLSVIVALGLSVSAMAATAPSLQSLLGFSAPAGCKNPAAYDQYYNKYCKGCVGFCRATCEAIDKNQNC